MAEERQSTKSGGRASARSGARPLAGARQINELVELLGDLLEATGLVTETGWPRHAVMPALPARSSLH